MELFRNKETNEVREANTFSEVFAFRHNSNWEKTENVLEEVNTDINDNLDDNNFFEDEIDANNNIDDTDEDEIDFTSLTVKELVEYLTNLGIKCDMKMKKDDLLALIPQENE